MFFKKTLKDVDLPGEDIPVDIELDIEITVSKTVNNTKHFGTPAIEDVVVVEIVRLDSCVAYTTDQDGDEQEAEHNSELDLKARFYAGQYVYDNAEQLAHEAGLL